MWNKADICAVLLSNETSTAPFPRCLQTVANISRTNVHLSFRRRRWSQQNFSENIQGNQSKDMLTTLFSFQFLPQMWCNLNHYNWSVQNVLDVKEP